LGKVQLKEGHREEDEGTGKGTLIKIITFQKNQMVEAEIAKITGF
jgi:uncharacterized protein YydD (DUF2326 family)